MIILTHHRPKDIHSVLFDFDGTISLIRQGWQDVMVPYFAEVLLQTPDAGSVQEEYRCAKEFIELTTGKQTIYQCMQLNDEVIKRGGIPVDPSIYKDEYSRRLMNHIQHRRQGLLSDKINPECMMIPGARSFLETLVEKGLDLYLASGTDHEYVIEEASLLDVAKYFKGNIFGAKADLLLNSKAMVIQRILKNKHLSGDSLAGFGDGYVEIENVKEVGGIAIGVAGNEVNPSTGWDEWKKDRLQEAGADALIMDFDDKQRIIDYLFKGDIHEAD